MEYILNSDRKKFLEKFQDISICSQCGEKHKNMTIYRIDKNSKNYLPSNFEPLCPSCNYDCQKGSQNQPFITIGKDFSFAGAHQLPNHKGLCRNLHGHEWICRVTIKKQVNFKTGMVMDFSDLKNIVNEHVISKLDHSYLNNTLENPTAENLLVWIWKQLMFKGLLKGMYSIDLWETKNSIATVNYKDMLFIINNKYKIT